MARAYRPRTPRGLGVHAATASAKANAQSAQALTAGNARWFVGMTAPLKEMRAQERLQGLGAFSYLPTQSLYRRKNRTAKHKTLATFPLIPRMLFVGIPSNGPAWLDLFTDTHLTGVIGSDGEAKAIPAKTILAFIERNG